jgi:hypothetical protein
MSIKGACATIRRTWTKMILSYPNLKTIIYRNLTQTTCRLASIHLLPWQFAMIKAAPFKSSLWSSRPLNGMRFFVNGRGTSPLQSYLHEIRRLHPNVFIEVPNILSLFSYHSIFKFWADPVGTFKRVNVKLETSKLNKVRSKQKKCTPSPNFRWYLGPVCLLESSFILESEFQESELFFDVW